VAVREIPAAAALFGPHGIAFVQAPHLPRGLPPPSRLSTYADLLLSQGWDDIQTLGALTDSWLKLMQLFRTEVVLLNSSPTALLACRVRGLPCVVIGNGFELPPLISPLPVFPGVPWDIADRSPAAEHRALSHANAILERFNRPAMPTLATLFHSAAPLLVTFPELDHYEPRPDMTYIGPLLGTLGVEEVDWPSGRHRVFAALRPDTENLHSILLALRMTESSVVCFAPGFSRDSLAAHANSRVRFCERLVHLKPLLEQADLCISYGAEGTLTSFLLHAVPQLIAPSHVESQMIARRIEAIGAGLALDAGYTPDRVAQAIERLTEDRIFRQCALAFSQRHSGFDPNRAARQIIDLVEERLR